MMDLIALPVASGYVVVADFPNLSFAWDSSIDGIRHRTADHLYVQYVAAYFATLQHEGGGR